METKYFEIRIGCLNCDWQLEGFSQGEVKPNGTVSLPGQIAMDAWDHCLPNSHAAFIIADGELIALAGVSPMPEKAEVETMH